MKTSSTANPADTENTEDSLVKRAPQLSISEKWVCHSVASLRFVRRFVPGHADLISSFPARNSLKSAFTSNSKSRTEAWRVPQIVTYVVTDKETRHKGEQR